MDSHAAAPATSALPGAWSFPAGVQAKEPPSAPAKDAAAQLRARLLKLIVANETARTAAGADASKPR